jgi:hypothetical protein
MKKVKVSLLQTVEARKVVRRRGSNVFLTFRSQMVVMCQPYEPDSFTPRKIPGTHFY